MKTSAERRLLLIGGSAESTVLDFVKLAGGITASVVILPHASGVPQEAAEEISKALKTIGVRRIRVVMPGKALRLGRSVHAVWMTGGDQARLVELLGAGGIKQLAAFAEAGGLVAGTSAGAAAVGFDIITGGMSDGVMKSGSLTMGAGLALLPAVVTDTHFTQRGRFPRLFVAMSELEKRDGKAPVGIGLDEDTAAYIVFSDGRWVARILGRGSVWFYTATSNFASNVRGLKDGGMISVRGVDTAALVAGDEFELNIGV
ncbi:MAG TPA: cyanophycinase [Candidatus Obscuribacterales bacterium]